MRSGDAPPSVTWIDPDGAAALAGLAVGDSILEIDGRAASADFRQQLASLQPGVLLNLRVRRAASESNVQWKVASHQDLEFALQEAEPMTAQQKARRAAWLQWPGPIVGRRASSMIRAFLMLGFWAILLPFTAILCFPWTFLTGDIRFLYRMSMWAAITGVRVAGVRVNPVGLEKIDPARTYIFMSNHASNVDPPLLLPLIPKRTSVMARHELFNYPILGKAMRMGSLVPVDRKNRDAGIAAVRAASQVIRQGINMTVFVEGGRSMDGKLLPFKKGPFYLAEECNVPIMPVTITGTHYIMPKGRLAVKAGKVDVIFHDPVDPKDFGTRQELMAKVRAVINSGLPVDFQTDNPPAKAAEEKAVQS